MVRRPTNVWPPVAGRETRCPGACQRQLVYVTDQLSKRCFLVDTGAAFSILPHRSSTQPSGPALIGPNGHPIACWGDKPVQLVLDGCSFQWTFLLPAVQFPIIGVDFIRAHQLLVDPSSNGLVGSLKPAQTSYSQPILSSLLWTSLVPLHLHFNFNFTPAALHPLLSGQQLHPLVSSHQHLLLWTSSSTFFRTWSTRPRSCPQLSMM